MKKFLVILLVVAFCGCASSTVIKTFPEGAIVKHNGAMKGITPYEMWDREPSDYEITLSLSKDGYKTKDVIIKKNVIYLHRLIVPPIIGLPWLFGYDTSYLFELEKN